MFLEGWWSCDVYLIISINDRVMEKSFYNILWLFHFGNEDEYLRGLSVALDGKDTYQMFDLKAKFSLTQTVSLSNQPSTQNVLKSSLS